MASFRVNRPEATIECVVKNPSVVGECPIWCQREQVLYWIDIYAPAIFRFDPATGENRRWDMPEAVGSIGFRESGGLIAGMASGFCFVDLETGALSPIVDPEAGDPGTRLNDGRCDRAGRFWAGSMAEAVDRPVGALYRLEPDLSCHKAFGGFLCSNGLAFSPDDRVLYHADTRGRSVFAYDFDIETGRVGNKRLFCTTDDRLGEGRPDGACVDEEGCYWSARCDGWRVVRHAPDGRVIRVVDVPVATVTMCAFGGEKLDILYVTTATDGRPPEDLTDQPLAGSLFAVDVGVRGLPEPRFAG
jgi:L-arabinonolactonase